MIRAGWKDGAGDALLVLSGDVGAGDTQQLGRRLQRAAGHVRRAVIDLSGVDSIDLGALDPLLEAVDCVRPRGVKVVVTPSWAEDTLRLTGR